jgi:hypothetical protein
MVKLHANPRPAGISDLVSHHAVVLRIELCQQLPRRSAPPVVQPAGKQQSRESRGKQEIAVIVA